MRRFPTGRRKGRLPYVIMIFLMVIMAAMKNQKVAEEKKAVKSSFREQLITGTSSYLEGVYSPVLQYAEKEEDFSIMSLIEKILFAPMPVLAYMEEEKEMNYVYENESTKNLLLMMAKAELPVANEGETVSGNSELLIQENQMVRMEQENKGAETVFQMQKEKLFRYDPAIFSDYQSLIKNFYIVDAGTTVGEEQINYQALATPDMSIEVNTEVPQILIYHTHSNETFADSVPGDDNTSIVGVGAKLAENLRAYGYNVMHHTAEYDSFRDDAYGVALPAIEKLLKENPSIEVVIDLHRDSVAEDKKLVTDIQGRPTAQIMFFNGLSRSSAVGEIDYLYNQYRSENLALSFQAKLKAMEYYPDFTRKSYLDAYQYNLHVKPKYLLVEMGAQNNTVAEMKNACDPLAHLLYLVLTGQNRE